MAYVNPYANAMNYKPRTLWEHPEPYAIDWSTFWGTPGEDDDNGDDNGDENGYNPEGPESTTPGVKWEDSFPYKVWTTSPQEGVQNLQNLWSDVLADIKTNYFEPSTSSGVSSVVPTGGNTQPQVYNAQDLNAVTQGIDNPTVTSTPVTEFQPSYNQQQQDLIDQSTQAYNQQQNSLANVPMVTEMIANVPDWRDMVGQGGLTQRQAAQSFANAPTVTYGNTDATNPTLGEILNGYTDPETGAEINFDAVTDDERDWGDFW